MTHLDLSRPLEGSSRWRCRCTSTEESLAEKSAWRGGASRGVPDRRHSRLEPRTRLVDAVYPAYGIAQCENTVNDFGTEGRALFLSEISRKAERGFRLVPGPQGGAGFCGEVEDFISYHEREIGVVVPGNSHVEAGVVDRSVRGRSLSTRGNRCPGEGQGWGWSRDGSGGAVRGGGGGMFVDVGCVMGGA